MEDLADVTEAIRQWLKDDDAKALVLNLPSEKASVTAKALSYNVLHDVDAIDLKIRLPDSKDGRVEACTQVTLNRT